jgi:hypothetical protein
MEPKFMNHIIHLCTRLMPWLKIASTEYGATSLDDMEEQGGIILEKTEIIP